VNGDNEVASTLILIVPDAGNICPALETS
jgi:hypothetical protein